MMFFKLLVPFCLLFSVLGCSNLDRLDVAGVGPDGKPMRFSMGDSAATTQSVTTQDSEEGKELAVAALKKSARVFYRYETSDVRAAYAAVRELYQYITGGAE